MGGVPMAPRRAVESYLRLRLRDDGPEVRRGAVDGPHALDERP